MSGIKIALYQLHKAVEDGRIDASIVDGVESTHNSLEECEVLDFKRQVPVTDSEYVKTMRDVVALHNSFGGFIVFGIAEIEKDRVYKYIGIEHGALKISKIKDIISSYIKPAIQISIKEICINDVSLEVIWVSKRKLGEQPVKFHRNGPEDAPGHLLFKKDEIVFRKLDHNVIARTPEDYEFLYSERRPSCLELSLKASVSSGILDHNLPDRSVVCANFVGRADDLACLWSWVADDFSRVRLIAGEGGLGKTSLGYKFSEEVVVRRVEPFERLVWLTAKERQFVAAQNEFRETGHVDFSDFESLLCAINLAHGRSQSEIQGCDQRELLQSAVESCSIIPSLMVIDDVDSLSADDQRRVMEFCLRLSRGTKVLLTARANFSYAPENVLKLDGLAEDDFISYVGIIRKNYGLGDLTRHKIKQLLDVTSGSPLYADSLIRLERRGLALDQAMAQWKGSKGSEVRRAALQREIEQLSREARRVLFAVSQLKNCSYVELSRVVDYTEQTLGDALDELTNLFLISAPSIAKEARYTVEPNTGRLVLEVARDLGIDHTALVEATERLRRDAVGIGLTKRSGLVALAISQGMASLKNGDAKGALAAINAAEKKMTRTHPDLLLAAGRFNMQLSPPNYDEASKAFDKAYLLGQRKSLLYDLWFDTELQRGAFDIALDVTSKAIIDLGGDHPKWFEKRAQTHMMLARRAKSTITNDAALREIRAAMSDLQSARGVAYGEMQRERLDRLIQQVRSNEQDVRRSGKQHAETQS